MIRLLVFVLVFLALGAAAAGFLRSDEGYVLLSFRGWVVETTAIGFALAVVALCVAMVAAWRLIVGTFSLPTSLREALQRRRERRARAAFVTGLRHLAAEDWKRAEIELVRRAADHDQAHLNYLFAARAARAAGEAERCEQYLALAAEHAGDGNTPVPLARAEMLRADGRAEEALPLLETLHRSDPRNRPVAALLCELYADAGRWQALQELLGAIERRKALPAERWQELMRQAATGQLQEARSSGRLEQLRAVWNRLPRASKETAPARQAYFEGLVALGAERQALELVARAVSADWDGELVLLYGRIEGSDPVAQLATVEQWLNKYGERPELLLVAGRTCLRNRLWGKARSYLNAAIQVRPTPDAYLELARLCQETQQGEEASGFYRRGLELATSQAD